MIKHVLHTGMHIIFVVSLPVALVAFSIKSPPTQAGGTHVTTSPLPTAASDTFTVIITGNTIARATIPKSPGTGTLILDYADSTYTLAIDSSGSLLSGLAGSGRFSQRRDD